MNLYKIIKQNQKLGEAVGLECRVPLLRQFLILFDYLVEIHFASLAVMVTSIMLPWSNNALAKFFTSSTVISFTNFS